MRLFDPEGSRLYLNRDEVMAFLAVLQDKDPGPRTFAETLTYTGCRISEALALTPRNIQYKELQVTFNSLKKRRDDVFRNVPVPHEYMRIMVVAHEIPRRQRQRTKVDVPLWDWSRQHAYELTRGFMVEAGIPPGKHRTPKGLRHAFGVNAVTRDVPITMLKKWMGHAQITTTAIYANAIGKEEALLAKKMWD